MDAATFPPGDDQPPNPVQAQSPWTINSPDGKVLVTINLRADGALSYAVDYAGQKVITDTVIGISTSAVDFESGLHYSTGSTNVLAETYAIPTGKRSQYVNHANELTLKFTKSAQELDLVVRAYDEGGAYRFAIPSGGNVTIASEKGGFGIPAGTIGWAAPPAADYQGNWDSHTTDLTSGSFELPVLVKVPVGVVPVVTLLLVSCMNPPVPAVTGKLGMVTWAT